MPSSTRSYCAPARSILFTKMSVGMRSRRRARINTRVCAWTPSTAEITSTAPSSTLNTRSTSAMKSGWPGVSIRLTVTSSTANDTTADLIVMPRCRSSAMESVWVLPSSTLPISSMTPAATPRGPRARPPPRPAAARTRRAAGPGQRPVRTRPTSRPDSAGTVRRVRPEPQGDGLRAVAGMQLRVHVVDVVLDGLLADPERAGDLGVGPAPDELVDDLDLASGQLGRAARGAVAAESSPPGGQYPDHRPG